MTRGQLHMQRVAQLPCVICVKFQLYQSSPTQAHHCICDRFSQKRADNFRVIPLCEGHHLGHFDTSQLAIHRNKRLWVDRFGPDYKHIPWVLEQLEGEDF